MGGREKAPETAVGPVCAALARGLVSAAPETRERAADEVTDVVRGLDAAAVEMLTRALVAAALRDTGSPLEAELHALGDLKVWHEISPALLAPLAALRGAVPEVLEEYLDEILGQ